MEIIKCDNDEIVSKVPNLFKKIEEYFGDNNVLLFACLEEDKKLSFVARVGEFLLYLNGNKVIPFGLKPDGSLLFFKKNGFTIYPNGYEEFSDYPCCQSSDGLMHSLCSYKYETEDINGAFTYFQYNSKNDTLCEITYKHYYCERDGKSPVYSYYKGRDMESVYVEKDYSKKPFDTGFVPKKCKYFQIFDADYGMIGYTMVALSEYGLLDVLMNGSYNLIKEDTVKRYVKSFYVDKDGIGRQIMWPLCKFHQVDEIESLIRDNGFGKNVPDILLDVYNDREDDKKLLEEFISLMNEVVKAKDNTKYMKLVKSGNDGSNN